MDRKENTGKEKKEHVSHASNEHKLSSENKDAAVTSILDERIRNLREAIEEIDAALARRKTLNRHFIEQVDREADEVKKHLPGCFPIGHPGNN